MSATSCSGASLAAGEELAATATQGTEWLLVEFRGTWGRDAIRDSGFGSAVSEALVGFPGKVILVRRPDRRRGVTVMRATVSESGGTATRQKFDDLAAVPWVDLERADLERADLERGELVGGPIVLVCGHGRRDTCCALLGGPLFAALSPSIAPERLWQASHLGGHRFAPNVLVLPDGVQLGRIPIGRAREVADLLARGRIPLDLYRGRTLYPPAVQAAEHAARLATGCDTLTDVRLVSHERDLVTLATPGGDLVVRVEERPGPVLPVSCGADPEQTVRWVTALQSTS